MRLDEIKEIKQEAQKGLQAYFAKADPPAEALVKASGLFQSMRAQPQGRWH